MNDDAANFGLVVLNGACIKIGRADKFCTAYYAVFYGEIIHDDDILKQIGLF